MKKIGKILWFIMTFLFLSSGFADVQVSANLDRDTVELGDSFVVELKVEATGSVDVERPEFPPGGNFLVLDVSQSSSQQVQFINGKVSSKRSMIYQFQLQAKKKGDLAIPRLSVVVDGKEVKAPALRVKVVDAGTLPNRPRKRNQVGRGNSPFGNFPGLDDSDPFADLLRRRNAAPEPKLDSQVDLNPNEAFQLRVVPDKTEAFVGEQITANYYIYIPNNYLLRSFDTVKYPNLKGFWKEDIEMAQTLKYETVVVEGRSYNRALLASYALFPIQAGTSSLDEYKAKCDVSVSGIFGFGKAQSYTKSSFAEKVKVKPLPVGNVPANFSGAVGSFNIQARIDAKQIKAHQPFPYKLRIEGKGNAKNLELPSLDLPDSLELFDTKEDSKFFKTGRSYKEFTLYLIPRVDGEVKIPELKISVFNPETEQYEEIKSGELVIDVQPGEKPQGIEPNQIAGMGNSEEKKEVKHFDFAFEKASPSWIASKGNIISWVLFAFVILGNAFYAKKELGLGSKEAKKIEVYEQRYKKLKTLMKKKDYRNLGVEGTNTIYATLNSCLEDVESGMELSRVMKKISPHLRSEIEEPLVRSLKVFQTLGFAPEEILAKLKEEDKQKEALSLMDKALRDLIKRHEV